MLYSRSAGRKPLFRRSPKTPAGQSRERFRNRDEEAETDEATERDVLGLVLPGNKVVVLANLKGKTETVQMKDLLPRAFDTKFLK